MVVDNQHIQAIAVDDDIETSTGKRIGIQRIRHHESRTRTGFGAAPLRTFDGGLRNVDTQVPVSQPGQEKTRCTVAASQVQNPGIVRIVGNSSKHSRQALEIPLRSSFTKVRQAFFISDAIVVIVCLVVRPVVEFHLGIRSRLIDRFNSCHRLMCARLSSPSPKFGET